MTKAFYEHRDRHEGRSQGLLPREYAALARITPELEGNTRLLDVGCGTGSFLAAIHERFPSVGLTGMEIATTKLDLATQLLPLATFVEASAENSFPFQDAAFDVVYAGEVIEHLFDPDTMIRECLRVLRPGGVLVVTTPNLAAWYNRLLLLIGTQPLFVELSTQSSLVGAGLTRPFRLGAKPVGHLRIFTLTGLVDLLGLHGFDVISRDAATFHAFPKTLTVVDRLFSKMPSLGSILVVTSRRRKDVSSPNP